MAELLFIVWVLAIVFLLGAGLFFVLKKPLPKLHRNEIAPLETINQQIRRHLDEVRDYGPPPPPNNRLPETYRPLTQRDLFKHQLMDTHTKAVQQGMMSENEIRKLMEMMGPGRNSSILNIGKGEEIRITTSNHRGDTKNVVIRNGKIESITESGPRVPKDISLKTKR